MAEPLGRIGKQRHPHRESVEQSPRPGVSEDMILAGRYVLEALIGEGGNGQVYRAGTLHGRERYAIKIIDLRRATSSLSARGLRRRIEREATALGRVTSPHILHLVDFIEIDDRRVALVMELSDGPTLEEVLTDRGHLRLDIALGIAAQIADACFEVHRLDIVHRDLKPGNVILEETREDVPFVYLLDFGTARFASSASLTDQFLGTPVYASPEQFAAHDPDAKTDIYALGAMLFHIVSARPPFQGRTAYALMEQHVHQRPPSLRSSTDGGPEVPVALDQLVGAMLAKAPEERPDTMRVVSRILRSIADELPDDARESSADSPTFESTGAVDTTRRGLQQPVSCDDDGSDEGLRCHHRDAQVMADVTEAGKLHVWDVSREAAARMWNCDPASVVDLEFSDDGYLLAVVSADGEATIRSTQNGQRVATHPASELDSMF